MKHHFLSALLLVGLAGGCKQKEEPAPVPLIVGRWEWGARQVIPFTSTGQIDPSQPPPTAPYFMTTTYEADGTVSVFANGTTRTSGTYKLAGNKLTQTLGFQTTTYTLLELNDKRLVTFLDYPYGTARYELTDYYTR